nr:hypothetical protein [Tanacetum cinerariifolium]
VSVCARVDRFKRAFHENVRRRGHRSRIPTTRCGSYYRPGNFEDPSPIVYLAAANGAVSNFKIQPNLIAIVPVFRGHEEPYAHLREFFSIADTYQVNNTTKDGVRLCLFPFSLKDQAKAWFTSLEPGEQFHKAFSRLKELLITCPHHDVPKWELVKVFYDGLDYHNQQFVMATSRGKGVPNVSQVSHNACSMCGDPSHSVNNCQSWGRHRTRRMMTITIALIIPNNKTMVTYQVNLERQMRQLTEEVHKREAGKLPSYLDLNPKHNPSGPEHVNMVTSLRNGKTYNNYIKIPSAHDFSHDVEDFVTDDEIIIEGKKADNVKSDSELVNDLLKDFRKPPTQNSEATESPKVGEGGV